MTVKFLENIIGAIQDKWCHAISRKRLQSAYQHILEHQKHCQECLQFKKDFLAKAHELANKDDYHKLLEHYGIEFWTNYFENEHPVIILNHSLIEHAPYRAYKNQKTLEDYMLLPSNSI